MLIIMIALWPAVRNTFFRSKDYLEAYKARFPPAEPVDEFDDRNRLYSIKVAMNYSAMVPGSMRRKTYVSLPFAADMLKKKKGYLCA